MPEIVDIVVPVFRGERETRTCLESVLASSMRLACEIVVVNDASPEPAITSWLDALSRQGRISLITHDVNRGFVASVNEAMVRNPARDVVLLNSDTEVAPGWLDRLCAHGSRDLAVATATPFSSNATICSYPVTLAANPLPQGESVASLDAAFAAANAGRSAEIPTAVGFCMYIARRAIERIGVFDEARYGAGYGEEVDFCMRAARAGMRNVAAGDVFVRHVGEVSFGDTGIERRAKAQAVVDELYPEFQVRLRSFLAADPLLGLRRRADLERLRRAPRARRLLASGEEAQAARSAGMEPLLLEPAGRGHLRLRWDRPGEEFSMWFARAHWQRLGDILRIVGFTPGTASAEPIPELEPALLVPPAAEPAPPTGEELAAARRQIEALQRDMATMRSSRSWKLTAPLRSAARRIRGLLT